MQGVEGHCHEALVNSMEKAIEDNVSFDKKDRMRKRDKIPSGNLKRNMSCIKYLKSMLCCIIFFVKP